MEKDKICTRTKEEKSKEGKRQKGKKTHLRGR